MSTLHATVCISHEFSALRTDGYAVRVAFSSLCKAIRHRHRTAPRRLAASGVRARCLPQAWKQPLKATLPLGPIGLGRDAQAKARAARVADRTGRQPEQQRCKAAPCEIASAVPVVFRSKKEAALKAAVDAYQLRRSGNPAPPESRSTQTAAAE